MTQYFFVIHRVGSSNRDCEGMYLPDNESAKSHALQVVRVLKEDGGYEDPALFITVEDRDGGVIFSFPFLGAA
jgi:hypothetical protein